MTLEDAHAAGRDAALAGQPLAGFPPEDDLFGTWLRGFREHQSFDPECAACGGTGLLSAGSKAHGYWGYSFACSCNARSTSWPAMRPSPAAHARTLVSTLKRYAATPLDAATHQNLGVAC